MRLLFEIVLVVGGIALLLAILKGLGPVFPALGSVLRLLLHPVTIAILVALALLLRVGRRSRRGPNRPPLPR